MAVEIEDAFLIAIHTYAYRTMAFEDGGISKIVGVVFCTPPGHEQRLCYKIEFDDGDIDYVPVSDIVKGHYKIIKRKNFENITAITCEA